MLLFSLTLLSPFSLFLSLSLSLSLSLLSPLFLLDFQLRSLILLDYSIAGLSLVERIEI